jgi:hypothetical protein
VLLGQVGTKCQQAVGVFEIVVAARRAVGTERALVAGRRRGHAQRGVAVVVVGADHTARQLAERVELLGHDLAGGDDGKRVAPVLFLDTLDLVCRPVQRGIPAGLGERLPAVGTDQRLVTAPGSLAEQFVFEDTLDAQLAAVHIGIGDAA